MIQPKLYEGRVMLGPADAEGSWKTGFVLEIGKIINHKGEEVESLVLEPQGIAQLISRQCVELPDDKCALAHVLTRMCNDGLLTLNIGVVDPSWRNHLSSPVLNFSSEKRLLQVGQPFIRLTFHSVDVEAGARKGPRNRNTTESCYDNEIRAHAVGNFGKSFLNIKQLVGRASKKENARFKEAMLKYLPIGAFSLAFFALLVTIGVATATRYATNDRRAAEIDRLEAITDQKQNEIIQRLEKLEAHERVSPQEMATGKNGGDGSEVAPGE